MASLPQVRLHIQCVEAVLDKVIVGCMERPAYQTRDGAQQTYIKTHCRHGSCNVKQSSDFICRIVAFYLIRQTQL